MLGIGLSRLQRNDIYRAMLHDNCLGWGGGLGLACMRTYMCLFILQTLSEALGDSRGQVRHNPCPPLSRKKEFR